MGAFVRCKPVNLAKIWIVIGMCCGALIGMGCERSEERAATALPHTPEVTPPDAGLVQIPLDSPQLQQLRVQTAAMVPVPTDEVTAPAKVGLNPNRVGRVALPVAGRITRVLVVLGDAVTQGQPLLTVDSPDVECGDRCGPAGGGHRAPGEGHAGEGENGLDRTLELFEAKAAAKKDVVGAQNDYTQAHEGLVQRLQAASAFPDRGW